MSRRGSRIAASTLLAFGLAGMALAQGPQPLMWAQDSFVIPYEWTHSSDPTKATRVELYASTDRGKSWQKISEAQPSVRYFTYRAPGDGEYWFDIRTFDHAGQSSPAGPYRPALAVTVDTQHPQIVQLTGSVDASGSVSIDWQAFDAYLDTNSWSLRYRTDAMPDWQTVTTAGQVTGGPNQLAGRVTFSVPSGTSRVWLQAQVRDRAGNSRELGAIASLSNSPNAVPAQTVASTTPSPVAPPSAQFGLQLPSNHPSAGDPFAAAASSVPSSVPPLDSYPSPTAQAPAATQSWPADTAAATPFTNVSSSSSQPFSAPFPVAIPDPTGDAQRSAATAGNGVGHFASFGTPPPSQPWSAAAPPLSYPLPLATGHIDQYVNQLEFEIDYAVDRAGTFGVSRVELWGSRDGGRSWRRLAIDTDNTSPIRAKVAESGDYGLRIVVETAGGLEPQTPRPGDRPELTLRVDTTPPAAQLIDVTQGDTYFADHLIINWQASDADLTETPITLSYSSRPHGPWIPLASGLANSGRYTWRLQRHLPGEVYIQLAAQDRGGNVTTSRTPGPVAIKLPIPSGQLQTVRPLTDH